MKVYLVGGAVRDEKLGLAVADRDWCVVGSTPEKLKALGYKAVGKDFPVFLHPESGEEYALARTERKSGSGYHGFQFFTSPDVTIEEDLRRRDLTINAMAVDDVGNLVDPFDGLRDLNERTLRHVSEAFVEDPLRVLRVARFAARYKSHGFSIASETIQLMSQMSESGELDELTPARIWKETESALCTTAPREYFETLRDCGALCIVFPELDALFGIPQPEKWHPEIDCGVHTMMVVEQAGLLSADPAIRFAALVHDLGKATTDKNLLPAHHGHEKRSADLVKALSSRLPVPKEYRELALLVAEFHGHCHRAFELKASTILKLMKRADVFRRPERFEKFLLACEADARGRKGLEDRDYSQVDYLRNAAQQVSQVPTAQAGESGLSGADIGRAIEAMRLTCLKKFVKAYQPPKR